MSIVVELQTYKGVKCHPILLLTKSEVITENTCLPPTPEIVEKLKSEGEIFIAVILTVDDNLYQREQTRPLVNMLRLMPRELWYVSWLEIAGELKAIVVHRGIEVVDLEELYENYDQLTRRRKRTNTQFPVKLTHTVDIDLLIINPELWERFIQTAEEGA